MVMIVCVKCGVRMKAVKNGVAVIHYARKPTDDEPLQVSLGENVTIINTDVLMKDSIVEGDIDYTQEGDLYRCPQCGTEMLSGFGNPQYGHEYRDMEKAKKFYAERIEKGTCIRLN
jgi:predicted RNA-binding Zn-ribbon protein involved in translation (DUF1610 family)